MGNFFEGMPGLLQGFWWVAIISTLIFLVQSIMTFAGAADTDGINADFNGDFSHVDAPFQFFSFRNMINFLLGFGWAGVTFYPIIKNPLLVVIIAALIGIAFVALFFIIIRQFLKLTEDNTFNVESLNGNIGEVYIPIPGAMSGKGKVQISYRGSVHEIDAMTEGEPITSGTAVKVTRINNKILIVHKI